MDDLQFVVMATNNEFKENLLSSPLLRDNIKDWMDLLGSTPCTRELVIVILMSMINHLHDMVEIRTEQITYLGNN